jgi:hypothetical protein
MIANAGQIGRPSSGPIFHACRRVTVVVCLLGMARLCHGRSELPISDVQSTAMRVADASC